MHREAAHSIRENINLTVLLASVTLDDFSTDEESNLTEKQKTLISAMLPLTHAEHSAAPSCSHNPLNQSKAWTQSLLTTCLWSFQPHLKVYFVIISIVNPSARMENSLGKEVIGCVCPVEPAKCLTECTPVWVVLIGQFT